MTRVRVCVDLDDEHYRALAVEAERQGVEVQALVERMMQGLLQELEQEEHEGSETPIIPS